MFIFFLKTTKGNLNLMKYVRIKENKIVVLYNIKHEECVRSEKNILRQ